MDEGSEEGADGSDVGIGVRGSTVGRADGIIVGTRVSSSNSKLFHVDVDVDVNADTDIVSADSDNEVDMDMPTSSFSERIRKYLALKLLAEENVPARRIISRSVAVISSS